MDEWDRWNEQRDREMLSSPSYGNVPQDVYGAGGYGQPRRHGWTSLLTARFGAPQVGSGLGAVSERPLGLGRLLWMDMGQLRPLGLGAVSLWALVLCRTTWLVLVSRRISDRTTGLRRWWHFLGFGPGIGVGFGFGNMGWVPLAPFEPLYAWWGHGFYAGYRNPRLLQPRREYCQRKCHKYLSQCAGGEWRFRR